MSFDHPIFTSQEQKDRWDERRRLSELFLELRSVNDWNAEAATQPNPKDLYGSLWTEGEIACLFADSNVGKSILAVQIAEQVAQTGVKVAYFDFELSNKQFQNRYTDFPTGQIHRFPDTFYRAAYFAERFMSSCDHAPEIMRKIVETVTSEGFHHIVIDNVNALTTHGQTAEGALRLMADLRKLKSEHNVSILTVAHTPKRDLGSALTDNDLAGSKNFFNLFDSAFAMGKVPDHPDLRYVKQLKVRSARMTHGSDNVMLMRLEKQPDGFLGLQLQECLPEEDLIRTGPNSRRAQEQRRQQEDEVRELRAQGLSIREIASRLGISETTASRRLRE